MSTFLRFLSVGVLNTILGYAIIFGCMYLIGFSPEISNAIGYGFGLILSFFLNKFYTFKSDAKHIYEFIKFLIVFAVAYGLNLLALMFSMYSLALHEGLSQILAGVVYTMTSFILNKTFVFKSVQNRE